MYIHKYLYENSYSNQWLQTIDNITVKLRIKVTCMGMDFNVIKQYASEISITNDLLEIGSDRGEGSTAVLSEIAFKNQKILHSVDIDAEVMRVNSEKFQGKPINFYNIKGEDFLDKYTDLKFSIVLLDNFDWDWWGQENAPGFLKKQKDLYRFKFQLDMTNINSQLAHLVQAIKLTNMLAKQCVIACDDTFVNSNQTYDGKGGAAVPYLLTLGFTPQRTPGGIVLVRK
jgi:hypothetical protein